MWLSGLRFPFLSLEWVPWRRLGSLPSVRNLSRYFTIYPKCLVALSGYKAQACPKCSSGPRKTAGVTISPDMLRHVRPGSAAAQITAKAVLYLTHKKVFIWTHQWQALKSHKTTHTLGIKDSFSTKKMFFCFFYKGARHNLLLPKSFLKLAREKKNQFFFSYCLVVWSFLPKLKEKKKNQCDFLVIGAISWHFCTVGFLLLLSFTGIHLSCVQMQQGAP